MGSRKTDKNGLNLDLRLDSATYYMWDLGWVTVLPYDQLSSSPNTMWWPGRSGPPKGTEHTHTCDRVILPCGGNQHSPRSCWAVADSLWPRGLSSARLLCPPGLSGKNTGVGCHFLLQGIFPTQGLNPCLWHLLHWQVDCLTTEPPENCKATILP